MDLRENTAAACEEFSVAHEMAHHLLWHTTSRTGKSKARAVVDEALNDADILGRIHGRLSSSQIQELHADILAFLMVAGAIDQRAPLSGFYRALAGSLISHIALADITGSWIQHKDDASHPDFIARFEAIAALTEWLTQSRPRGPIGDHPLGFLAQLAGFGGFALNAWLHRTLPDKVRRVDILDITSHVLKLAQAAEEKIPPDSRNIFFT